MREEAVAGNWMLRVSRQRGALGGGTRTATADSAGAAVGEGDRLRVGPAVDARWDRASHAGTAVAAATARYLMEG